jgi:uncharacterized membrane protein YraQ (UPF0718 family)
MMTVPPNSDVSPPQKPHFKKLYVYSGLLVAVIVGYVAYIFFSRYEANNAFERRNAEKTSERRGAGDRTAIEQLGGSDLTIRAFYASPSVIHRGESAELCYDVANAKTVTLDPPEGSVWPSHTRCLKLSPKKTTTYTLTITDVSGKTASQTVELKVR